MKYLQRTILRLGFAFLVYTVVMEFVGQTLTNIGNQQVEKIQKK
jgi:hypothetical protein